jgi:TatD DNase family protein
MILTDSHAHLSLVVERFGRDILASLLIDYAQAWESAMRLGHPLPLILEPGVDPDDLAARVGLLDRGSGLPPFMRLAAGIWPSAANLASPETSLLALEEAMAEAARRGIDIAAIGEGGLDYHHMEGEAEVQARLFEGQIAFASDLGLPMIVHSRDAAADTLAILARTRGSSSIILHCFGYGPAEARAFLDLDCWISFAGNISYKGSDALREACALVPADRLLLETDSPYMNPTPRRGKGATPLDIERTYALAADLRGVSLLELADTISVNAHMLFG